MLCPPPPIEGVVASRIQLPPAPGPTLIDGLCQLFPSVARQQWVDRLDRGRVMDAAGNALTADAPYRVGIEVYYYREVADEKPLPPGESLLHIDARLVVADKPHGLPVTASGDHVVETLQARLIRKLGNPHLVPLHRIDRDTAGLVLFSADPGTRHRYHALFSSRAIAKRYEAIAPGLPSVTFPHTHRSRLVRGEPFFRMHEVPGIPNSKTRIEVMERGAGVWRYSLHPVTGRKHQLRVHMAALSAPIVNDALYPELLQPGIGSTGKPMQLIAKCLRFIDPMSGTLRVYRSGFELSHELYGGGGGDGDGV